MKEKKREKMKRYPKYKDSGIPWIGEIPAHWEVIRLKYYYRFSMGATILKSDLNKNGNIPVYSATEDNSIFGYVNNTNVILEKNDFVIPARGNSIGHVFLVEKKSTCTQTTIYAKQLQKNKLVPKFVFYYQKGLKKYLFQFDRTAIPQITVEQVKNNPLLFPSFQEQFAIANYLDRKTAEIDEIIAKKERLLELYEEEKKAIINKAVTKGINPNVKMKDSGVPYLGEIPQHWEVKKLKYVGRVVNGSTPNTSISEYWNGDIKWVTPVDVNLFNGKIIYNTFRTITLRGMDSCGTTLISPNSIIITTRAPIGNIALAGDYMCTNQGCKSIVDINQYYLYLFYFLISVTEYFNIIGKGSTFKELSTEDLKDFIIPVPPLDEQKQIVNYIESQLYIIDQKIEKTKKSIELLKEYKTALISEVVTGKRRVLENY